MRWMEKAEQVARDTRLKGHYVLRLLSLAPQQHVIKSPLKYFTERNNASTVKGFLLMVRNKTTTQHFNPVSCCVFKIRLVGEGYNLCSGKTWIEKTSKQHTGSPDKLGQR